MQVMVKWMALAGMPNFSKLFKIQHITIYKQGITEYTMPLIYLAS
jgi:hypothetical protein